MALWMIRAGKQGEYEKKFLNDNKVYLTWDGLTYDLSKVKEWADLIALISEYYPNVKQRTIISWVSQIWPFFKSMKIGDLVAVPSKLKPVIHIGRIKSDYKYDPKANDPYYHCRDVDWIKLDIPRSSFGQDLLYSLGAFMTVCQIKRNDAEQRVEAMIKNKSVDKGVKQIKDVEISDEESDVNPDLEELAKDQIAKQIIQKFKGHGMAKLVEAILKAQGYLTYVSPEGPDHGVDILASLGPLGFGHPRVCVQVKSSESPIERVILDQLIGVMQNFNAEQGLLVSWGGFRSSFDQEIAKQFFKVRLWNQNNLIEELLKVYEKLDDELKAELPLKRIWTVTSQDE